MIQFKTSVVVLVVAAQAFGLGACRKRLSATSEEVKTSPEGRPCPPSEGTISDGESNSNQINTIKGRGGYWYTFVDKKGSSVKPIAGEQGGTFEMAPGGPPGSHYAAHMSGQIGNADIVYAGMGLNFVDPKGQYDASAYKGVSFWAKKGAGTGKVRLKVPDVNTEPDGKVCTECFDDFGVNLNVTDDWQLYTVPFKAMSQFKDWGAPHTAGIVPAKLYGLQFQVNEKGSPFDIWIDNIQFTGCP